MVSNRFAPASSVLRTCGALAACAAAAVHAMGHPTPPAAHINLTYAPFDPLHGEPFVPAALRADAANELYLVQVRGVPVQAVRDASVPGGMNVTPNGLPVMLS
jgi:hypothetical protein